MSSRVTGSLRLVDGVLAARQAEPGSREPLRQRVRAHLQSTVRRALSAGFVDLRGLAFELAQARRHRDRIHVYCTLPAESLPVFGHGAMLRLALRQVFSEAARICPLGGILRVEASAGDEDMIFSIHIRAAVLTAASARGLPLARAILAAHGGLLERDAGKVGELRWIARIPRARPRA